jgi:hypothetical protein
MYPRRKLLLQTELLRQLAVPLSGERSRDDDYNVPRRTVEEMLSDDDGSLDRLAEPDLIRKQIALRNVPKHTPRGLDLMGMKFNGCRRESCHLLIGA